MTLKGPRIQLIVWWCYISWSNLNQRCAEVCSGST